MENQELKKEQKDLNPYNYGYFGDEQVVITGEQFDALRRVLHEVLTLNINETYPQLYNTFDAKTHKPVKNPTDEQLRNGTVKRRMDMERTIQQEPKVSYNETGIKLMYVRMILEDIHFANIQAGVVPTLDELRARAMAAMPKPEGLQDSMEIPTEVSPTTDVAPDQPLAQQDDVVLEVRDGYFTSESERQ